MDGIAVFHVSAFSAKCV